MHPKTYCVSMPPGYVNAVNLLLKKKRNYDRVRYAKYTMTKLRRVFVAIRLPGGIKSELLGYREKWGELPARWVSKENLHLTLAFLGNTSESELARVISLVETIGEKHPSFEMRIVRLQYGPDEKRPRMIWAFIEKSPELIALQKDLEEELATADLYAPEKRPYSPHLTLARFHMTQFRQLEPEERPQIAQDISLAFEVQSIEVMESRLKRSGAEYAVLQSIQLRG